MKKISLLVISLSVLLACTYAEPLTEDEKNNKIEKIVEETSIQKTDTILFFEDDKLAELPKDWSQYFTGKDGEKPNWQIVDDKGNKVLAQLTKENPNYHFNIAVFDKFAAKNIELSVKLKGVDGSMDQGGGFVWRFIDENNYYVVRANPLEDNVVLYKVESGKRTDLPLIGKGRTYGAEVDKLGSDWNELKLNVKGDLFTVYLNGKEIFQVKDRTFTNIGKVGFWTKADAITYFDNFQIKILE